jgi:hypothetical protein
MVIYLNGCLKYCRYFCHYLLLLSAIYTTVSGSFLSTDLICLVYALWFGRHRSRVVLCSRMLGRKRISGLNFLFL